MKIQYTNTEPNGLSISLSEDIGIDCIRELRDIFELRIANSENINIHISNLDFFDLSTLQLLLAVAIECKSRGVSLNMNLDIDTDNLRLIEQTGVIELLNSILPVPIN